MTVTKIVYSMTHRHSITTRTFGLVFQQAVHNMVYSEAAKIRKFQDCKISSLCHKCLLEVIPEIINEIMFSVERIQNWFTDNQNLLNLVMNNARYLALNLNQNNHQINAVASTQYQVFNPNGLTFSPGYDG